MRNHSFFSTGLTYSRNTKSPLEDKFVFDTLDAATNYINDIDQTAYVGQILSITNDMDNTNNGLYFVDSISNELGDNLGTMHKIGKNAEVSVLTGDKILYLTTGSELASSISLIRDASNGQLSLVGVDDVLITDVTIPISEKVIGGEIVNETEDGSLGRFIKLDIQTSETDSSVYRSLYIDVAYFDNRVNVTYDELVALSDNEQLVPGSTYRITDYTTSANLDGLDSAHHDFDLLVKALSPTELDSDAKAISKDGDTYFQNSNLADWKIKYALKHNDKFRWAHDNFFRTENTVIDSGFKKILNSGVQYLGIKEDNILYYSTDLVNWNTDTNFGTLYDISFLNGYFCIICKINNNMYLKIYDMTLGNLYEDSNVYNHAITYETGNEHPTDKMKLVQSDNGVVVIHESAEENYNRTHLYKYIPSTDYLTSVAYQLENLYSTGNIIFNNFKLVGSKVVGLDNDTIQYYLDLSVSTTGNWSVFYFGSALQWHDIAYDGSIYIATSDLYNNIFISSDLITWNATYLPYATSQLNCVYSNNRFIIYGNEYRAYETTDGILFKSINLPYFYTQAEYKDGSVIFFGEGMYSKLDYYFEPCKGVIYEMIDEFNNKATYDFKNIKMRNNTKWYYTFDLCTDEINHRDHSVESNNGCCVDNTINNLLIESEYEQEQELPLNIFKNTSVTSVCSSNKLNSASYNIFGDNVSYNDFGVGFNNNEVGNGVSFNSSKGLLYNSIINDGCIGNTFGKYIEELELPAGSAFNIFEGYNGYLTFSHPLLSCTIKSSIMNVNFTLSETLGEDYINNVVFNTLGYSGDIIIENQGNDFTWIIDKTTSGDIVQYCMGDVSQQGGGLVEITYDGLLSLKNNSNLSPGTKYRITDYVCTTTQEQTQSAGHQFDIIIEALSNNTLSEEAKAIIHSGDTYFANNNLDAWELKYTIDNDNTRFAWADSSYGKGVIYYMKDEWNNECPYDFKNIQYQTRPGFIYSQWGSNYTFTRDSSLDMIIADVQYYGYVGDSIPSAWSSNTCWLRDNPATTTSVMYKSSGDVINYGGNITAIINENYDVFTFSKTKTTSEDFDISLNGLLNSCYSNTIRPYFTTQEYKYQLLNRITFVGLNCYSNTFGDNCYSNRFGNNCYSNTLGDGCYTNTLGNGCYTNTLGNGCYTNTFGNYCTGNTIGTNCTSNTFGNSCFSNIFGDGSWENTFGTSCYYNIFGNSCFSNTFGTNCTYNTFGNGCSSNKFYHGTSGTTKKNYIKYIVLEDGCQNNNFYSTLTTSSSSYLQRIRIKGLEGTYGTRLVTQIGLTATNAQYEWVIAKNSSGTIKQYCPEDRLTNNYTYKIEDTIVSTWVDSTAYAGYGFQAQINIPNLTENDTVSVTFAYIDAISGNYYPTIQIYEGYILVFTKVDATITIPTIEITKIIL